MSPRHPRWLLWATLPATLLVIAFGLWLRLDVVGPTSIDQSWLGMVGLESDSVPYWIAVVLAEVGGGTGVIICTGLLAAFFVVCRRFRAAGFLVSAMLVGVGLSELLKAIVTRVRPDQQLYDSLGWSYPSGHSMGAAALASALAIITIRARMARSKQANGSTQTFGKDTLTQASPSRSAVTSNHHVLRFHWSILLAAAWILLMMWSRTALQVHWLTDTLAGALVGISAAVLADEVWTWAAGKLSPRPKTPR